MTGSAQPYGLVIEPVLDERMFECSFSFMKSSLASSQSICASHSVSRLTFRAIGTDLTFRSRLHVRHSQPGICPTIYLYVNSPRRIQELR